MLPNGFATKLFLPKMLYCKIPSPFLLKTMLRIINFQNLPVSRNPKVLIFNNVSFFLEVKNFHNVDLEGDFGDWVRQVEGDWMGEKS
jgi:hypothetical protein